MDNANPEPAGRTRTHLRYLAVAVACAPAVVFSLLHTMGRTGDYGVLGKWYVMLPLTVAAVLAWNLIERAATWATRSRDES